MPCTNNGLWFSGSGFFTSAPQQKAFQQLLAGRQSFGAFNLHNGWAFPVGLSHQCAPDKGNRDFSQTLVSKGNVL